MAKSTKKAAPAEVTKRFTATEKNRDARLERHIKKHPNDAVAKRAVSEPAPVRKKAKAKGSVSKDPVYKVVVHLGKDVGFKAVVPRVATGSNLPFREPNTPRKVFEDKARSFVRDSAQVFKETQGRFGKVPVKTEQEIKDNVKALCFGLGIHYTGKAHAPRRPYKGKR